MSGPGSVLDVKNVTGCMLPTGSNPPRVMALISGVDEDDNAEKCTLMEITSADKATLKLGHDEGMFNPSLPYMEANGWPSYKAEATVTCFLDDDQNFGPPVFQRGYFVDTATRSLRRAEGAATPAIVAPDIMDLQAEYGVLDQSTEPPTLSWISPTGTWATPTLAQLENVRALRVALVARNSQYEKPVPGEECATTTTAMVANRTGPFSSSSFVFDTTNYPDDWQCYRYKVFETVIPLRNGIWGKDG
jgi:type IV pilus assembly protein PilW